MRVGYARAAAADWVSRHARDQPGFRGAYLSGSTISLPDDAELPANSDVDVLLVSAASQDAPTGLGKLRYRGVLLDIGRVPEDRLRTPEQVLGSYRLAGSFRTDRIIADPTGRLRRLQAAVAAGFARRHWVGRRCDEAVRIIEDRLARLEPTAPSHRQVTAWLFAAGGTAHLPLVAALRNPTVRLRYLAAREVLADYRLDQHYRTLLELLNCADLSRDTVARQLDDLSRTFDAAAAVARTRFAFSSDIAPPARHMTEAGSSSSAATIGRRCSGSSPPTRGATRSWPSMHPTCTSSWRRLSRPRWPISGSVRRPTSSAGPGLSATPYPRSGNSPQRSCLATRRSSASPGRAGPEWGLSGKPVVRSRPVCCACLDSCPTE